MNDEKKKISTINQALKFDFRVVFSLFRFLEPLYYDKREEIDNIFGLWLFSDPSL